MSIATRWPSGWAWGAAASAAEKAGAASPAAIGAAAGSARPGQSGRRRCPSSSPRSPRSRCRSSIEAVGTVQAIASIQIKPRIDSQIMKVNVEEGALVKEGDLLFELDDRTLKAQLGQIEAQIRKDQAQIVQAKRDTARADGPADQGCRHGRHSATPTPRTLKSLEAQLESDEASRQNVLTQLSYTEIRAPVSGRIGSISSKAGTVVRIGDNTAASVLATINQVDPIFVSLRRSRRSSCPTCAPRWPRATVKVNAIIDDNQRAVRRHGLHREHRRSQHRHGDRQGAHRQRQRRPVARPVRQGRGRPRRRAEAIVGAGGRRSSSARRAPTCSSSRTASPSCGRWSSSARRAANRSSARACDGGEQVVVDGQLRLVNGADVAARPAPRRDAPRPPPAPPRG